MNDASKQMCFPFLICRIGTGHSFSFIALDWIVDFVVVARALNLN